MRFGFVKGVWEQYGFSGIKTMQLVEGVNTLQGGDSIDAPDISEDEFIYQEWDENGEPIDPSEEWSIPEGEDDEEYDELGEEEYDPAEDEYEAEIEGLSPEVAWEGGAPTKDDEPLDASMLLDEWEISDDF